MSVPDRFGLESLELSRGGIPAGLAQEVSASAGRYNRRSIYKIIYFVITVFIVTSSLYDYKYY